MRTPLLLVSTATRWYGTARIPRGLAKAGFDVALLTPRNSLAEKSRFIATIGYLPDDAAPKQWLDAFVTMVADTSPRIVIPCDDTAFRLLSWLGLSPPPNLEPRLQEKLTALVRASLGDPRHYDASIDKTLLPAVAQSLGVRVPAFTVVAGMSDAERFAARHGYPLVLKRAHGFAGQGVAICSNRLEIAESLATFASADSRDPLGRTGERYLLQAFVRGQVQYFHAAAWNGELVAGWALEKIVANPAPTGPPTVTRYFSSTALREAAVVLANDMGMSGFFFAEFIIDPATGEPLLLEINRRVSPATHRGEARDVDLCAALHAAVHGRVSSSRSALADGEEGITVHFPQEWLRDLDSHWLREYPSDVPWDEPELFEAMVATRNEA
jgi:hypothetical protein